MIEIQQLVSLFFQFLASIIIGTSVAKNPVGINERMASADTKSKYKDEKLEYIYKNRSNFQLCNEERYFSKSQSEQYSQVYQISDTKYIIKFACNAIGYYGRGQNDVYLLYSIRDNGIDIGYIYARSLIYFNNGLRIWSYRLPYGAKNFDPETLTLRASAVKNGKGHEEEYVFENDEFKLTKYTELSIRRRINTETQQYELVQESEDIYP
ncbi:hypothetical protein [Pseudanabaena sp. 'Roaring Creek']|uniref:hypothetical protein n=1 Tax=Pseudanabaena sp. 'Roaring Creek' TaxID=1681830 RepID=UPI0006D83E8C|nr:hypothetical protein [Pseudanabaena sp. 'Roaring Creek']